MNTLHSQDSKKKRKLIFWKEKSERRSSIFIILEYIIFIMLLEKETSFFSISTYTLLIQWIKKENAMWKSISRNFCDENYKFEYHSQNSKLERWFTEVFLEKTKYLEKWSYFGILMSFSVCGYEYERLLTLLI